MIVTPQSGLQADIAFSVAGVNDPQGDPLTHNLEFGDGSTSAGATVMR